MMGTVEPEARREVAAVQERLLADASVEVTTRFVQLDGGPRLQVLEAGQGEPLVLLHGSGNSAVAMLPLVEQIKGRRVIVVDRPGYGLSDPIEGLRDRPRKVGVDVVEGLLDALDIQQGDLVGNSYGGFLSLWTALDRPERVRRVILVGATPLLPGTKVQIPLKMMTTPGLNSILRRVMPEPSRKTVIQMMKTMGEDETIVEHPGLIDAFVAAGKDPVAGQTVGDELAGVIRGFLGWRPAYRFTPEELQAVQAHVLLIWGDHDSTGTLEVAHAAAQHLPNAQVAEVPTGHGPWFGEAKLTAELITRFLEDPATQT